MSDPDRTEKLGGSLPTGVLFYGAPGTGKTAAAKALAKHLGWTLLTATGAELSRDVAALEKIYRQAKEFRPSLVFIDEADELIQDRGYSGVTQATNKLLTLMDGAADRVRDVVWIAATNHPDQIDPALLRGGRFTEKVAFDLPSPADLLAHIRTWLDARGLQLESGLNVENLVEALGQVSIATAEAIVQSAVNHAIGRGTPVVISHHDVQHAIDLVVG
jgi:transitional endoplasmic reticulum ATPase